MSAVHNAPTRRIAPARRRDRHPHPSAPQRPASEIPSMADTVSARRCGTSQDQALYRCDCGSDFLAAVSASVGCPDCGTTQDW